MNNFEIIEVVEKVSPHFKFNIEDIYGDNRNGKLPKIEELDKLFFKLDGKDKKNMSINEQNNIVNKITILNVGLVEYIKIPCFGKYIVITPYKI